MEPSQPARARHPGADLRMALEPQAAARLCISEATVKTRRTSTPSWVSATNAPPRLLPGSSGACCPPSLTSLPRTDQGARARSVR